jgi:hypothetical protein
MGLYGLAVFVGAFLLFQVQPLIAKYILPWFGGAPSVWTTCLLFFQAMLLAGYAYAHGLTKFCGVRRQALVHCGLLGASLLLLPMIPSAEWKPQPEDAPTLRILLLLAATIGAPYFLLSATAPLVQSWFGQAFPGRSPYRLYALSNAGSLLALVSYPFVFEMAFRLPTQSWLWSAAYAGFLALCSFCAWRLLARRAEQGSAVGEVLSVSQGAPRAESERVKTPPRIADVAFWITLSALGTIMLMATTNRLCQEVASVPFLWILPLSLYLLTFIICFDHPGWYRRSWCALGVIAAIGLAAAVTVQEDAFPLAAQLAIYGYILFVCCMTCHGELVQARPGVRHLTLYYLMISTGGVLGGVFVALAAPRVFSAYYEFGLGLAACCLVVLFVYRRDAIQELGPHLRPQAWRRALAASAMTGMIIALGIPALGAFSRQGDETQVLAKRNFYGVLRVDRCDAQTPHLDRLKLVHGKTVHGVQFQLPEKRRVATAYYAPEGGVGQTMQALRQLRPTMRVGVVGLGVGTLAAYAEAGDRFTFYEIDPKVEDIARQNFRFLSEAQERGAVCEVRLGDARIVLEHELSHAAEAPYDLLVIDAFSSDAIPVHLLTAECFQLYWGRLTPDGVLAVHVSNRYVDLTPVVRHHANVTGKKAYFLPYQPTAEAMRDGAALASHWIVVSGNSRFLNDAALSAVQRPWPKGSRTSLCWTDDFSNLFQVLRREP